MKPPVKPAIFGTACDNDGFCPLPPPILGDVMGPVQYPCPSGLIYSPATQSCVWNPPIGGYLCSRAGQPFACGGVNQPADPCMTARGIFGNATCVVDGQPDLPPATLQGCGLEALSFALAVLVAVVCP